jgi:hypothetical protein
MITITRAHVGKPTACLPCQGGFALSARKHVRPLEDNALCVRHMCICDNLPRDRQLAAGTATPDVTCKLLCTATRDVTCKLLCTATRDVTCQPLCTATRDVTCKLLCTATRDITCKLLFTATRDVTCKLLCTATREVTCKLLCTRTEALRWSSRRNTIVRLLLRGRTKHALHKCCRRFNRNQAQCPQVIELQCKKRVQLFTENHTKCDNSPPEQAQRQCRLLADTASYTAATSCRRYLVPRPNKSQHLNNQPSVTQMAINAATCRLAERCSLRKVRIVNPTRKPSSLMRRFVLFLSPYGSIPVEYHHEQAMTASLQTFPYHASVTPSFKAM